MNSGLLLTHDDDGAHVARYAAQRINSLRAKETASMTSSFGLSTNASGLASYLRFTSEKDFILVCWMFEY